MAAAVGLIALAAIAVRLAVADWLSFSNSLASRERATRLAPRNSQYLRSLADLRGALGQDVTHELRQAAQLDPMNSRLWIALGLAEEEGKNAALAERDLLYAAQMDKGFFPAWTLTNYYFREEKPEKSLQWAKKALSSGTGDLRFLFNLCWLQAADRNRLPGTVIPLRPEVITSYLQWLTATGELDAAYALAPRVIRAGAPGDRQAVLGLCDALVSAARPEAAVSCWNMAVQGGLLGASTIASNHPMIINGRFAAEPIEQGFDWRIPNVPGVRPTFLPDGLRLTFSGEEPERCEVLQQVLVLAGRSRCRLNFVGQTAAIAPNSGLQWHLYGIPDGREITASASQLWSEDSQEGHGYADFEVPEGTRLYRLALLYQRRLGTVRIEGWIKLTAVSLEPRP